MKGEQRASDITHILAIPLPAQGHINPMLQFAKSLASKGLKVTLVTPNSIVKSMQPQASSVVNIEFFSDGTEEGPTTQNTDEYFEVFKAILSRSLVDIIAKYEGYGYTTKLIVYDSHFPWILDLARKLGVDGAPFFTQPCAVNAIYYHFRQGRIKIPLEGPFVSLPSMPRLRIDDLPSFISDPTGSYQCHLILLLNQFSNFHEAKWIFCNSFDKLEDEVLSWMSSQWPIKNIGPTIPSMYLDKQLKDDKNYGISLFKPNVETCMKWLDSKEIGTVVYAAFGSLATLGEEQMEEIVWGLKRSNSYFLLVVRESEKKKLPVNFLEEISEKGLVVNWCPQLEVLAHKAVGCFITHCGWNSTLEALSLGVPMVAVPQWTDQPTNAKFIADVWQVGVRVKMDEKGIVTREGIEACIREVMEGDRAVEIKKNSIRWKELAREAVSEGGSSDKNLEEFVAEIAST